MLSWIEDCTLYQCDKSKLFEEIKGLTASSFFEEILYNTINSNTLEINYSWIDPIRMNDKIVAREQRSVTCWVFKSEGILCCFGNSESGISYAVSKLGEKASISFSRIDTFNYWKNLFHNHNHWFADLIGVHVKSTPSAFDKREIKKISVNNLSEIELSNFIDESLVTNLTLRFKHTIFYLDLASVISFPNTVSEDEVFMIIQNIVKDLSESNA